MARKERTKARLAAVQALYQKEMSGAGADGVIEEFLATRVSEDQDGLTLGEIDRDLFGILVREAIAQGSDLDDMLTAVLPEDWPVERLDRVLRVILRMGVLELSLGVETPARVVIKEYVDLAHDFFSGREPALANGVLDRIAHMLRPDEFDDGTSALDALADTV